MRRSEEIMAIFNREDSRTALPQLEKQIEELKEKLKELEERIVELENQ